MTHIPRLGIGGPVGSGKSMLIERIVPMLAEKGYSVSIISNDVISKEDADRMRANLATNRGLLPENLVVGLATGGCPHTAIREDPSMNLSVIEEMESKHPDLDLIIIESGGDNITTTFSPILADYFIYIIDVAGGDKYPRKGGLGIESCDLLVINKIDLASMVGADLDIMKRDAKKIRNEKPFEFINCKTDEGVMRVTEHIIHDVLFGSPKSAIAQKVWFVNKLEYYTPDDIPKEILVYADKVKQLGVGKSGKVGILDVELQMNSSGKTVLTKQFSQVPLQIQRALYPETALPGMAYLYVLSPSGGILQGDRYRTDVLLKNKAIAHMTTQGATKIYGMNSNSASQIVNITVDENCYLEYIPDQIIPYKNSRYYQKVNLNVHDNSTLIYSEILTPGRVAMGESFEYDICYLRTHCRNQDKEIRFLENTKIEPKKQNLKNFGVLGEYSIVGTVYIFTRKEEIIELENIINQNFRKTDEISVGTSILPDESGIIIRILGTKTDSIFDVIFKTLEISRKKILGASFSKTRKN